MTHKYRITITLSSKARKKLDYYSSIVNGSKSFVINVLLNHGNINHYVNDSTEVKHARSNARLYDLINRIELDYNGFCNNFDQLAMALNVIKKTMKNGHYYPLSSTQSKWLEHLTNALKKQASNVNNKMIEAIQKWRQ